MPATKRRRCSALDISSTKISRLLCRKVLIEADLSNLAYALGRAVSGR
jgi:hypothetical protein